MSFLSVSLPSPEKTSFCCVPRNSTFSVFHNITKWKWQLWFHCQQERTLLTIVSMIPIQNWPGVASQLHSKTFQNQPKASKGGLWRPESVSVYSGSWICLTNPLYHWPHACERKHGCFFFLIDCTTAMSLPIACFLAKVFVMTDNLF